MRPYVNARAAVNGIGCMLEWRGPHTYLRPRTSPGASPSLPSGGPTKWSSWYCGCGSTKWEPVNINNKDLCREEEKTTAAAEAQVANKKG